MGPPKVCAPVPQFLALVTGSFPDWEAHAFGVNGCDKI
jgi:hypothetical protein